MFHRINIIATFIYFIVTIVWDIFLIKNAKLNIYRRGENNISVKTAQVT
jgi:hypothetical protein